MDSEEDPNSKEALRIAIRILRERCNTFQKRIGFLEDENKKLKSELNSYDLNENSLTEMDIIKQRLACAEEQNVFLLHKMKVISQENLQLWSNLGKLTNANKSLGSHLNKINDSISQHVNNHQPLIRSKTFTQERPTVNDSTEKLDLREEKLGLENVSLKLMTNMTDVQNEVDSLTLLSEDFKNIGIFDNVVTSSLGFKCDYEDESNDFSDELKLLLKEMEYARDETQRQNKVLRETLQYLEMSKENHVHETKDKSNVIEISKMCPMCSQQFSEEFPFSAFVNHVESHFKS